MLASPPSQEEADISMPSRTPPGMTKVFNAKQEWL